MEIDLRFFFPLFFFPSSKLEAIETKGFNRSREDREPRASYWSFQKEQIFRHQYPQNGDRLRKKNKKQIAWHLFYNQRPDLNNLLKKTYGVSNNENKKHLIFKIAWEIPTKSQINPKSIRISTWKPQIRAKNSIESTKLPMKNHIPEKKTARILN